MSSGRVRGHQLGLGDVLHLAGNVKSRPGIGQVARAVLELKHREAAGPERGKHDDLPRHDAGPRKGQFQVARLQPGRERQPEDISLIRRNPLDGCDIVIKAPRDPLRKSQLWPPRPPARATGRHRGHATGDTSRFPLPEGPARLRAGSIV